MAGKSQWPRLARVSAAPGAPVVAWRFTDHFAAIARNPVQDPTTGELRAVQTPTYEGTIPGPTLRLKPGDTLDILLVNQLPLNPSSSAWAGFPRPLDDQSAHPWADGVAPREWG